MRKLLFILLSILLGGIQGFAQEPIDTLRKDSSFIEAVNQTSLSKHRKKLLIKEFLKGKIHDLNDIDTTWIAPNYYNWAFMIQNTNTFENFSVRGKEEDSAINKLDFSPSPTLRLGAYFGWRWLFFGYTFNVKDIFGTRKQKKVNTEIDLSIYTSKVGIDLYYRKTGNDFQIQNIEKLLPDQTTEIDPDFTGLNINITGVNVYYIFNHRHFSFPATFSQSTEQRRSCGSFKLGFSYTLHSVTFDHTQLPSVIEENISDAMKFNKVHYSDYNISFGYAYNWVFKRNWVLGASFTPALAYTHSRLEQDKNSHFLSDLTFNNLNIDLIGRLGLVYNDAHYFAGLSFIIHSFNYQKSQFAINNTFSSLNFYVGLNFKRKKEYQNQKF